MGARPGEAVRSVGYGPPADVYPRGVGCIELCGEGCDDIDDSYVTWLFPLGDCAGSPGRPLGSIACAMLMVSYVTEHHLGRAMQQCSNAAVPGKKGRLKS